MQYKTITSPRRVEFDELINTHLKDGWKLYGFAQTRHWFGEFGSSLESQAMIKYEDGDIKTTMSVMSDESIIEMYDNLQRKRL